jgi:hypothetical protein
MFVNVCSHYKNIITATVQCRQPHVQLRDTQKSPSWGIPYSRYAGFVWCNGSKVLCWQLFATILLGLVTGHWSCKVWDRFIRYSIQCGLIFLSSHYFLCANKNSHLKFPRSVQINPHFFLQTSPSTFPNQRNQNNIAGCRSSGSERRSARSTRTTCGAWTR